MLRWVSWRFLIKDHCMKFLNWCPLDCFPLERGRAFLSKYCYTVNNTRPEDHPSLHIIKFLEKSNPSSEALKDWSSVYHFRRRANNLSVEQEGQEKTNSYTSLQVWTPWSHAHTRNYLGTEEEVPSLHLCLLETKSSFLTLSSRSYM